MRKVVLVLIASLFLITGCESVKKYKQGVYKHEAIDNYNNENNIASAVIEVDESGKIVSVFLDTTYNGSTKKTLRDDYNMKKYNQAAAGEWYEQVEKLEKAVIEHQGIDFITLKDDGTTDTVSGCTIKIDALIKALTGALEKAK